MSSFYIRLGFWRALVVSVVLFVFMVTLTSSSAQACYKAAPSHQSSTAIEPDSEFSRKAIDDADVAFVGIVTHDPNRSAFPTFRVIAPIKGAEPNAVISAPQSDDCDAPAIGELWLYTLKKPAPSEEQLHIKLLEALGISWTEDTNRQKYGVYAPFKLRDACGQLASPLKSAQLKDIYHIDISTMPRFDLDALSAKAAKGDADAQEGLKQYYECQKDDSATQKWARKEAYTRSLDLARNGDPHAAAVVGWSYAQGIEGVKQDYSEAAKWLKLAVPAGDPLALTTLAHLYLAGNGVDKDDRQASLLLTVFMRQAMGFPQPVVVCPGRASKTVMRTDSKEQMSCEQALRTLSPAEIDTVKEQVAAWEKAHCELPNTLFPCHK